MFTILIIFSVFQNRICRLPRIQRIQIFATPWPMFLAYIFWAPEPAEGRRTTTSTLERRGLFWVRHEHHRKQRAKTSKSEFYNFLSPSEILQLFMGGGESREEPSIPLVRFAPLRGSESPPSFVVVLGWGSWSGQKDNRKESSGGSFARRLYACSFARGTHDTAESVTSYSLSTQEESRRHKSRDVKLAITKT
jgi:hypothetical protein